ncbi:DUF418 domain-containing protein (plasmid) [Pseudoalteromonas espejiana]
MSVRLFNKAGRLAFTLYISQTLMQLLLYKKFFYSPHCY